MSQHFPAETLSQSLLDGLQQLGIEAGDTLVDACMVYLQLLAAWNKAYNLTAIREYPRMVSHHLLDSLAVLPYLQGGRCLDVGTGAGLPGLILALAHPHRHWVLLDSNHKKIRFVNQACLELAVDNVEVVCQRVEAYKPSAAFSTIICRAYARLDRIIHQAGHLLAPDTCLLAMKGADPVAEVQALDTGTMAVQTHMLTVPGVNEPRALVEIRTLPTDTSMQ